MKKFLPVILLVVGIIVVGIAFFFVRRARQGGDEEIEDESALIEVPLEKRPIASLTPSEDGHFLFMKIEKLMVEGAESLDYELLYKVQDGGTQGVPGTIKLKGQTDIERELLLGSESSGKFRYDEGVERGTLTLRFRNERGKLMAKFSTDFHLQSQTKDLTTIDGKFKYTLDKATEGFFVVMQTFGIPEKPPGDINTDIYGVFASTDKSLPGSVGIEGADNIYRWADDRFDLESINKGNNIEDVGIFAGIGNIAED
jgi:hypothetical protein